MSRLSLRARLVLGVLALATVGLLTADVATYTSLRSFLLQRVDTGLQADIHGAANALGPSGSPGGPPGFGPGGTGDDVVELRSSNGSLVYESPVPHFFNTTAAPGPNISSSVALHASSAIQRGSIRYLTVGAVSGGGSWRVLATSAPNSSETLMLATSLESVDGTLHDLLLIELITTVAVLVGVVGLGLWIVRLGLRPLAAIGSTAELITAGDLSHRVERADERTEVGRLGAALNTMLDRIEAADARLRRFVADASHELRTPLSAVRAYAELFERGAAARPDDLARAMGGIQRESERMSTLVDDLLLLARLDEGLPLEHQRVELDALTTEAVETARTVDPERRIDLATEPLVVYGDATRLRQVLDNLLANVRAHTPPGTGAAVRLRRSDGSAVVEITDEGPGIAGDDLPRLFERFYRTDSHRSRAQGGTGLGLSIVAAIADAHGGGVAVSSEPGHGTRFEITLPLADGDGHAAA
jgi:two-component system OmpR family sensor kinase